MLELVATTHAFDDFAAHLNDAARHVDALHPASPGSDVLNVHVIDTGRCSKEGDARDFRRPNETLLLPYSTC